jgi:hypothetical protein
MALPLRSVDQLHDERLRRMYNYWNLKRDGKLMPSRSDIDPVDLSFCLGYLCLAEVVHDPGPRFRFRVDGSNCVGVSGIELTGRFVDEIPLQDYREVTQQAYERIIDTKQPHFYLDDEVWDSRHYQVEGLLLPLSPDGVNVNMIIDVMLPSITLER